jgi:hypothetical protein
MASTTKASSSSPENIEEIQTTHQFAASGTGSESETEAEAHQVAGRKGKNIDDAPKTMAEIKVDGVLQIQVCTTIVELNDGADSSRSDAQS